MCRWSVVVLFLAVLDVSFSDYQPNWDSLDKRPLPKWFDEAKIGIFMHWGVFSVPSFGSEWFWMNWKAKGKGYVEFMSKNYKPGFQYQDFAPEFTAEFYNPQEWAEIFKASGAKYVVLTSKHHEGYTLFPSPYSWNWNARDVGSGRDLLGELASAIRNKTDLRFGVYYSLFEWFHPLYLFDKGTNYTTRYFVENKMIPEWGDLISTYKPEIIWSDGDWEAPDRYWTSPEMLAWLYNKSPVKDTVVVNDRWGSGIPCHHGGYYTCTDRYNPKTLQKHKWENAMTLDKVSWGYRRNASLSQFLSVKEIITTLAETVSCGGNLLINIGPTKDGRIIPLFEERLRQLGSWLQVNGEGIYGTRPWTYQNDTVTPGVWYTSKDDNVYAIVLSWPSKNSLTLGALSLEDGSIISMLGVPGSLKWSRIVTKETVVIFPSLSPDITPSPWAWVLKITKPNIYRNDVM